MRRHEGPVIKAISRIVPRPGQAERDDREGQAEAQWSFRLEAAGVSLPGSQEGGASAHWADQVNSQVSAAVVGESQPGLDMLQSSHGVSLSPAGLHLLPHLQTLANIPAGHKDPWARQPAAMEPLPHGVGWMFPSPSLEVLDTHTSCLAAFWLVLLFFLLIYCTVFIYLLFFYLFIAVFTYLLCWNYDFSIVRHPECPWSQQSQNLNQSIHQSCQGSWCPLEVDIGRQAYL